MAVRYYERYYEVRAVKHGDEHPVISLLWEASENSLNKDPSTAT